MHANVSSRLLRCAFAAMGLGIAFELLWAVTGLGGSALDSLANNWVYMAVEFVAIGVCAARVAQRREQRLAWTLMTLALVCWSVGDLLWAVWLDNLASPPFPSAADVTYLLMYPAMYGALMVLIRSRNRKAATAQWLDGGVVALAVGAVAAALAFADIARTTTGRFVADAVTIAYPVGDFMLLMFVVLAYALAGWRPGRDWLALGSGVVLMAVADIFYADQVAGGIYISGALLNVAYLTSFSLLALAAWAPSSRRTKPAVRAPDTIVAHIRSGGDRTGAARRCRIFESHSVGGWTRRRRAGSGNCALSYDVPGERQDPAHDEPSGRHGFANGLGQSPAADLRSRGFVPRPSASGNACVLRPRWVQALQRHLRAHRR